MTFFVQSDGRALLPCKPHDARMIEALPKGVALKVSPKQPRNLRQHRLFWAFATLVSEALNAGPSGEWTPEKVVTHIKLATGRVELMRLSRADAKRVGVDVAAIPSSISFAKMDGVEFGAFMEKAFAHIRDNIAPWIADSPDWPEIRSILQQSGFAP